MRTALLVLDVQKDFCLDTGRFPVARDHVESMIANVNTLVARAESLGHEVMYIKNAYRRWQMVSNLFRNHAAMRGAVGADFDDRVHIINQNIYPKHVGSALSNADLIQHLQKAQVQHLVVTGLYAEGCVKQTVADALKRGYQVTVIADAVAGKSDDIRSRTLTQLHTLGARICMAADGDVFVPLGDSSEAGVLSGR